MRFPDLAGSSQEQVLLEVARLVNKNLPKKAPEAPLSALSGVAESRRDRQSGFGTQMADRLGQPPRVSNQSLALRSQKSDSTRNTVFSELEQRYANLFGYIALLDSAIARAGKDLEKKREDRFNQEKKNQLRRQQEEGERISRKNAALIRGNLELSTQDLAFAANPIAAAMQTEKRIQDSLAGPAGKIMEPTYTRVPGMESLISSNMGPEVPPELRTPDAGENFPAPAAAPSAAAAPFSQGAAGNSSGSASASGSIPCEAPPPAVSSAPVPNSVPPLRAAAPAYPPEMPVREAVPPFPVSGNEVPHDFQPDPEDEVPYPGEEVMPEAEIVSYAQDGDDETDITNSMVFTDVDLNIRSGGSPAPAAPEQVRDEVTFSGEPVTSHRHYLGDVQDSFTQDIMRTDLQEAERAVIIFAVRLADSTAEKWHLALPDSYALLVTRDMTDNMSQEFSGALGHPVEISCEFTQDADFSRCPDALARAYCRNLYASERESLLRNPSFQDLVRGLELNLGSAQFYLEDRKDVKAADR